MDLFLEPAALEQDVEQKTPSHDESLLFLSWNDLYQEFLAIQGRVHPQKLLLRYLICFY